MPDGAGNRLVVTGSLLLQRLKLELPQGTLVNVDMVPKPDVSLSQVVDKTAKQVKHGVEWLAATARDRPDLERTVEPRPGN